MKQHNSISSRTTYIGGTIPVLCAPHSKRMHGAMVENTLALGEVIAAGTPFEFNLANRTAKFLKCWKIKSVSVSDDNTVVTLSKTCTTPILHHNSLIMVMPDTLSDTGKTASCGTVTQGENTYIITLPTVSFDALEVNGCLVETSSIVAGEGKSIYCQPNNISTEDTIGGNIDTMVDVPRGHVYMYQNTIPYMPEVVKKAVENGDAHIVWENFNTSKE